MNRKKLFWIIISIILLLSLGIIIYCSFPKEDNVKNNDTRKIDLAEKEIAIQINEKVKSGELVISLIDVEDSRCPKNVECFWEGELKYSLDINDESYEISTVLNKEIKYNNYLIDIVPDKCNKSTVVLTIKGEDEYD